MVKETIVAVLPVGEIESDLVRTEYEAMLNAVAGLGTQLIVAEPVGEMEAAVLAARQLAQSNPDLMVVLPVRGLSAQAIEAACLAGGLPCAILPTEGRYALPSSTLAVGALHQAGLPVELLYGPPGHPEFQARLSCIFRAARAYSRLKQSRIGIVGSLFPNLVSARYDVAALTARLGTTLFSIPYDELRQDVKGYPPESQDVHDSIQRILSSYEIAESDHDALVAGTGLHLALKQLARERRLDGFALECWSGFPREIGLNPCLGFIEDAYILACEGDVQLCVTLLVSRYLSGSQAYAGDLYDLNMDGQLTAIHCGAPASLASNQRDVILGKSQLALERGFDTITCRPRLQPGPVTILRFHGPGCDQLHLSSGELLSSEQSPSLAVKVKIAGDRWEFLAHSTGNHYVVAAGDWRAELKLLSQWLKISVTED